MLFTAPFWLLSLLLPAQPAQVTPAAPKIVWSADRPLSWADFRAAAGVDLSDETILRAVTAWGGLLGAISLELFGHLHRAVTDYDAHFALVLDRLDPARA